MVATLNEKRLSENQQQPIPASKPFNHPYLRNLLDPHLEVAHQPMLERGT